MCQFKIYWLLCGSLFFFGLLADSRYFNLTSKIAISAKKIIRLLFIFIDKLVLIQIVRILRSIFDNDTHIFVERTLSIVLVLIFPHVMFFFKITSKVSQPYWIIVTIFVQLLLKLLNIERWRVFGWRIVVLMLSRLARRHLQNLFCKIYQFLRFQLRRRLSLMMGASEQPRILTKILPILVRICGSKLRIEERLLVGHLLCFESCCSRSMCLRNGLLVCGRIRIRLRLEERTWNVWKVKIIYRLLLWLM